MIQRKRVMRKLTDNDSRSDFKIDVEEKKFLMMMEMQNIHDDEQE